MHRKPEGQGSPLLAHPATRSAASALEDLNMVWRVSGGLCGRPRGGHWRSHSVTHPGGQMMSSNGSPVMVQEPLGPSCGTGWDRVLTESKTNGSSPGLL